MATWLDPHAGASQDCNFHPNDSLSAIMKRVFTRISSCALNDQARNEFLMCSSMVSNVSSLFKVSHDSPSIFPSVPYRLRPPPPPLLPLPLSPQSLALPLAHTAMPDVFPMPTFGTGLTERSVLYSVSHHDLSSVPEQAELRALHIAASHTRP